MKKLIAILFSALVPMVSWGASFTLGAGTAPEADATYINGITPNTNYKSAQTCWVDGDGPSRLLINWPRLKDSLYNRTADSGYIEIKRTAAASCGDCSVDVYQVRPGRPWVEDTATYNNYRTSTAWTTAGCGSTASDRYNTLLYSQLGTDMPTNTYIKFYITGYLQAMDMADTTNGVGVIFIWGSGSETVGTNFYLDDAASSTNRPKITVFYHTPPTPYSVYWRAAKMQ